MSELLNPIFTDADKAREYLEGKLWPKGPVCPHCGNVDPDRITASSGKSHRSGLYTCNECRKQFTVTVGTLYERSHVPLNKWLLATFLLCSSKKGISARQLHRSLGVTYKTAWFMAHRIREGMRDGALSPMGGNGGTVEADETFIGREPGKPKKRAYHHKMKVLSLVDRETRKARSVVVDNLKPATILPILEESIAKESLVMTDEGGHYYTVSDLFEAHGTVRHGQGEYGIGEFHTNTVEGYFSIFKRGMKGVYQHCAKKHLHRYLAEFDFRYNHRIALGVDDAKRAASAVTGIAGKRLTYRRSHAALV